MTKWQYGFAVYKPAKQSTEAFNNMIDMAELVRGKDFSAFPRNRWREGLGTVYVRAI
jgi:hypothetical protein